MKTTASNLVIPVLLSNLEVKEYTFREITEPAELEKAFRLRYEVYEDSENNVFLKKNQHKVDINVYDLHAKHYGLFVNDDKPIGYLRVVLNRVEYYNSDVFDLGKKFDLFTEKEHSIENIVKHSSADFPFLNFPNVPKNIKTSYDALKAINEGVAEAGRIAIHKDYRSLRTSGFLIECAIALYVILCIGKSHAIICCSKEHGMFYKRYGFNSFGEERYYDVHGTKKVSMCLSLSLSLSLSSVPKHFHSKFEEMVSEFENYGEIKRSIN